MPIRAQTFAFQEFQPSKTASPSKSNIPDQLQSVSPAIPLQFNPNTDLKQFLQDFKSRRYSSKNSDTQGEKLSKKAETKKFNFA